MESLVNYGHETDDEIVKRHMHRELHTWISHLDAMNVEADQLAKIVTHRIGDKDLRDSLLDDINENINLLNEFYTYRNLFNNVRECDETECDQFYIQKHDFIFEKYVACVSQNQAIKDSVYKKLLV